MSKTYEVDISVTARPFLLDQTTTPFADRTATFTVHATVNDDGIEASAKAIADGLEAAATKARQIVGPRIDGSTAGVLAADAA